MHPLRSDVRAVVQAADLQLVGEVAHALSHGEQLVQVRVPARPALPQVIGPDAQQGEELRWDIACTSASTTAGLVSSATLCSPRNCTIRAPSAVGCSARPSSASVPGVRSAATTRAGRPRCRTRRRWCSAS